MKTFLVHGDDTQKSYARLSSFINEAKKRSWEVIYLDDSPLTITENISSSSLFGNERFLVHRDFAKVAAKELQWIKERSVGYEGNLVFYADRSLPPTLTSKLPKNTKIEEFKLPVLIWKFLDSFYPGNAVLLVKLLSEISDKVSTEFIFGLLARLMRDLYWVKNDPQSLTYPSWRLSKLKIQAAKFTDLLLEKLIEDLSKTDIRSKTSDLSLKDSLDFLIIDTLQ